MLTVRQRLEEDLANWRATRRAAARSREEQHMSSEAASRFLDQLVNDPELRENFRSDPDGTMVQAGLTEEERQTLSSENLNDLGDEELAQRVSKSGPALR
jgi:Aromatic-ring-opening dioxygenase LigAB, LigA subunit/Nif11 domain